MPRQFLNRVTITGLDTQTDLSKLELLTEEYPFVEWGILAAKSKEGQENRYPPLEWVKSLEAFAFPLAIHICGSWARDVVTGDFKFLETNHQVLNLCDRIQLNVSTILETINKKAIDDLLIHERLLSLRYIIQVGTSGLPVWYNQFTNLDFLFDCSGGRGVTPTWWPVPVKSCGYAGGLTPENLEFNLEKIEKVAGNHTVWVDVESGVRTSDIVDLVKAQEFLRIAEPYVIK